MKYVFGPVPSRRLGRSLGVDPVPFKTCNWNCVYCQLGRTVRPTNGRSEYVSAARVVAEIEQAIRDLPPGSVDWLTFVGSGETTLNSALGLMIERTRALSGLPVAVITNGALLGVPEVRNGLLNASAVLPTLDAGSERLYRLINRPMSELDFDAYVSGLVEFRRVYRGQYWVEVMLVKGLNDSEEALREIAGVVRRVEPDQVHINLPVRPPCEPWVLPPEEAVIERSVAILGAVARVVRPVETQLNAAAIHDLPEAIESIVTRHPMSLSDLQLSFGGWAAEALKVVMTRLEAEGRVKTIERHGQRYLSGARAEYVSEELSQTHGARTRSGAESPGTLL